MVVGLIIRHTHNDGWLSYAIITIAALLLRRLALRRYRLIPRFITVMFIGECWRCRYYHRAMSLLVVHHVVNNVVT